MLGRILCRLGVHDTQMSGWNQPEVPGQVFSTWGYCTRNHRTRKRWWYCSFAWQLDNP